MVAGVYHYVASGSYKYEQGSCSSANAPGASASVPASTCPAGQSVGYVNGVALCYTPATPPPTGAAPPVTTQKSTATVANGDGSSTTTTTQTNGDGSQTVTSTTTQANGNAATTTQNVPPVDPNAAKDFCAQNPNDASCQKKSECEKNPKAVGCAELGDNPIAEEIVKTNIPISFNEVSIPANASCPTPIQFSIAGHAMTIPYDSICTFAAGIRPVFIAMAYLSAALIMIGGIRENA